MNPTRQERFEAIFAAHYGDVHRYALRRAEPPLAEEVVNETFLVAWRRLEAVPDEPLPWLYAAAGNVLSNRRRDAQRHARRAGAAAAEPPAHARDPAERLAERDAALRAFARPHRTRPRGPAPRRLGAPEPRRRGPRRGRVPPRVRDARPPRPQRLAAHLREQDADHDFAAADLAPPPRAAAADLAPPPRAAATDLAPPPLRRAAADLAAAPRRAAAPRAHSPRRPATTSPELFDA